MVLLRDRSEAEMTRRRNRRDKEEKQPPHINCTVSQQSWSMRKSTYNRGQLVHTCVPRIVVTTPVRKFGERTGLPLQTRRLAIQRLLLAAYQCRCPQPASSTNTTNNGFSANHCDDIYLVQLEKKRRGLKDGPSLETPEKMKSALFGELQSVLHATSIKNRMLFATRQSRCRSRIHHGSACGRHQNETKQSSSFEDGSRARHTVTSESRACPSLGPMPCKRNSRSKDKAFVVTSSASTTSPKKHTFIKRPVMTIKEMNPRCFPAIDASHPSSINKKSMYLHASCPC